jgi:hypothetical protein
VGCCHSYPTLLRDATTDGVGGGCPSRICAIGGRDSGGNVLSSIECLVLGESSWTLVTGGLKTARFDHAAALTNGGQHIHVYGGTDGRGLALTTVEVSSTKPGVHHG